MEAKRGNIIKKGMYGCIMLILLLPLSQQVFQFATVRDLGGAVVETPSAKFNWKNWFNSSYQDSTSTFLNDNFGFRNDFIRVNNQLKYSLYSIPTARGVIIGKEGYLYEENYIKAFMGTDALELEEIEAKTEKLAFIQSKLRALDKRIIILLAPGKGTYFSEFIPFKEHNLKKRFTNYDLYKRSFDKNAIEYLDFQSWFLAMKDTSTYPLYPKCGIHWSKYAELLVADSLTNYLSFTTNATFPYLQIDTFYVEEKNKDGDYDIGEGMNLFFEMDTYPMAYPHFKFVDTLGGHSPKVLTIADSYYWGLFNRGMSRDCFNDGQFWYYNQAIYPDSYENPLNVSDLDILEEAEKNDVILIISTDANLHMFAFGFIDQLYSAYQKRR